MQQAQSTFGTLPDHVSNPENPVTDNKVALGKKLFYDTRLSRSNTISCNSCHNMATYGVDNNPTSMGHGWRLGPRNAPTVLNAALHNSQFWDGRAKNVEEQAKGPMLNPVEMGGLNKAHSDLAVKRIASIDEYVQEFKKAFPDSSNEVSLDHITAAIGAYERTLLTPAPIDRFMNGQTKALTSLQKRGLQTFMDVGCNTCHNGVAIGGEMYQKFGLVNGPYWKYTGSNHQDKGRGGVTGKASDNYVFKVPTLRNITHTYPYFHDGSVWDLEKAVQIMATTQLGKDLNDQQTKEIVAFLQSLTGEIPEEMRTLPLLPPSNPNTPKPDFSTFRDMASR
jgi:cytochrome c peroxidase